MKRYSPSAKRYIEVEYLDQKSSAPPDKSLKAKKSKAQNYLHEDMEEIVSGLNATSIVWIRLLQLRRMRKEKLIVLSNDWLERHGVTRYAKTRALQTLERRGLIRMEQSSGSSPRVVIIPRRERRRTTKGSVAEPLRCAAGPALRYIIRNQS